MATHLNPVTGYAPYQSALLSWVYDSFGNYQKETLSGNTQFSMPQPAPYTYTSANQIVGFNYDAAGNQLSDPVLGPNTYVYDAENRVYSSGNGSTTYLYDAEGQRVAKYSGGTLTNQYLLGLGGEQVTELDGNGGWLHSNAYAAGKLLATYDNAGLHFQFSDWLGSRRVQADGVGNVEETCLNLPFGDMLNCSGSGSDATEQHFTGKFHDNESGLDYFGARYLNSGDGRFMSPDWSAKAEPVPYAKLGDPQSLNLYAYVGNNPLGNIDANGHTSSCGWICDASLEAPRDPLSTASPAETTAKQDIDAQAKRAAAQHVTDSVTVTAKSHWWNRLGHWFGGTSLAIGFARFGRLGGPAHRQAVDAASRMLRNEGYNVSTEKYVRTPNGAKSGRFIDVYGTKDGSPDRAIQIGRTNADNVTPVSREVSAMDDIQGATGMRPQFLDYQSPYPMGEVPIPGWPVQPPVMMGPMIAPEEDVIP